MTEDLSARGRKRRIRFSDWFPEAYVDSLVVFMCGLAVMSAEERDCDE